MEPRQPLPEIHYGACNFLGAFLVNQVSRAGDARHGEAALQSLHRHYLLLLETAVMRRSSDKKV